MVAWPGFSAHDNLRQERRFQSAGSNRGNCREGKMEAPPRLPIRPSNRPPKYNLLIRVHVFLR
jgi:hypothetical protein